MKHHFQLLLSLALAFKLAGCASGSAIVTGTTKPPVAAEQVAIYLDPPADFEVIGLVSASSDAGWTEQGSMNYAIDELKKQAGALGANGVLLVSSGERVTTAVWSQGATIYAVPVTAKTVQGRAIFVRRK